MQINNETLGILVNGIVWVTAIVIFGRLGMFIATKYFKNQKPERVRERQYIGRPIP